MPRAAVEVMSRCCESATAEPRRGERPDFHTSGTFRRARSGPAVQRVSGAMGIFEPLPVAWDCLHGDLTRLPTSADALSAAELTTLNDARGMLLAVCAVDQISEESVDSLLSEAWQGQEAPLVLAARVLRRICAMEER